METDLLTPSPLSRPADSRHRDAQDERRAQILEAARTCFARSGFRGASMQEICAEAKMSPGALYRYFPAKEAIIEAIAAEERCDAAALVEALRGSAPLLDRFVACTMGYFAFMRVSGSGSLMAEISAESLRNDAIGRRFREIDDHAHQVVREELDAAIARGEIQPIDDLEAVIATVSAAIDGIAIRQLNDPDLSPERLAPVLRRLFAGALGIEP